MSRDFQIAWQCPHIMVEEVVPLGTDRRSLPTRQAIASTGTVRILVNDELFVPQGGLYSPAELFGTVSGPFDLFEGKDVLTVETPKGSFTTSFGIVGAGRLTTDQVIKFLLRKNFDIALPENSNGHLAFTDVSTKLGNDSFVRVSGTGATALGFGCAVCNNENGNQRGANGTMIYPGWVIQTDGTIVVNRYPKFTQPVRANPIFKVTYVAAVDRCLRCRTTYVENDYRFGPSGQAIMIQDENLLYQEALKVLLMDKGSNPYHPWYGATIRQRIGSKALTGVAALISEDVRRALARLQALQESQSKYQTVSFKERLYTILKVSTSPHPQDPTTFMVDVVVQNASTEPINLTIVFTVPEVVALMGSNGLMLGTEPAGLGRSIVVPNSPIALLNGS